MTLKFTKPEMSVMSQNHTLRNLDINPADDPDMALGILLDNSTWDKELKTESKAALTSAIRKLATYVSQHYVA